MLPNFLIVGAARSGTTSLYFCLKQHPEVFMPERKEPHFFVDAAKGVRDREAYEALFAEAGSAKAVGEASTGYLYAPESPRRIKELIPDARIIIILRNPTEVAFSLWYNNIRNVTETLEFEEALAAEPARMADPGKELGNADWPYNHFYFDRSLYHDQVKRYLDMFERSQVFVGLFDDLVREPGNFYSEVVGFLRVDRGFVPGFGRANTGVRVRSRGVDRFLREPPGWAIKAAGIIPVGLRRGIVGTMERANRRPRPKLKEETRRELERRYREDIEKLSSLIGRDLQGLWLGGSRARY